MKEYFVGVWYSILNIQILFFIYWGILERISKIESLTYHKPTDADEFKVPASKSKMEMLYLEFLRSFPASKYTGLNAGRSQHSGLALAWCSERGYHRCTQEPPMPGVASQPFKRRIEYGTFHESTSDFRKWCVVCAGNWGCCDVAGVMVLLGYVCHSSFKRCFQPLLAVLTRLASRYSNHFGTPQALLHLPITQWHAYVWCGAAILAALNKSSLICAAGKVSQMARCSTREHRI